MLQAGKARIVVARRPVRYPQIERFAILCLCLFARGLKNQYWRIVVHVKSKYARLVEG